MIHFDSPKGQSSIIKVIGVGGGGGNAVNHMFGQQIEGVDFIICNTDAQAIALSSVPNKIQLGPHLTQGLGAGANPSIGRQATEESLEEIRRILEVNTKMVFITAGMGGGTGTGGAPIIARICKELGILTVGIVTTPFSYEGKKRLQQAEDGINYLKENVDTLLVISNDKLRNQFGNLKMKEAFGRADNVLATAAKCITDVINTTGQINVDFADVCTVMRGGGVAILGSASAEGEDRAQKAIENALNSPLLNDNDIRGAKWILINITSAEGEHEYTMDEVEIIQQYIIDQAGENTDVILGMGYDDSLGTHLGITLIATGFSHKDPFAKENRVQVKPEDKIVFALDLPEEPKVLIPLTSELPESTLIEKEVLELRMSDPIDSIELPSEKTMSDVPASETINEQEQAVIEFPEDPMMPVLKEYAEDRPLIAEKEDNHTLNSDEKIFFEISTSTDQIPSEVIDFDAFAFPSRDSKSSELNISEQDAHEENDESDNSINQTSGSFLAKPTQIYADETTESEQNSVNEIDRDLDSLVQMELVIKEDLPVSEHNGAQTENPFINTSAENNALNDESEEALRRRAAERIAKLRSLSFNVNTADPSSEFETVPAYMRRNVDLTNQIADIETFYSSYTVKPKDENQAEISTLNTFLEGKKPD